MKFGFRREKQQPKVKEVITKTDMDAETIRETIRSAASSSTIPSSRPSDVSDNSYSGSGRQVGILMLPGTQSVTDFWTLYKNIQRSGIPHYVGIFNKTNGTWTEEQIPE